MWSRNSSVTATTSCVLPIVAWVVPASCCINPCIRRIAAMVSVSSSACVTMSSMRSFSNFMFCRCAAFCMLS
ncbi:hypothetical protein C1Y40_05068 [Mycobacterium talmoniae]|uniref:Uncharacterized protein n=1 Tax=Mycobacterium talmoniae TaxID=1858794 RepID=A0A2S8BDQ6_9MYCO|nr:hypothetical protein C1Y40_05068 [Mycobacterium talmoniae]